MKTLNVNFPLIIDNSDKDFCAVENQLNKIAKKFKGESVASGAGFGGREVVYDFPNLKLANGALNEMENFLLTKFKSYHINVFVK